MLHVSYYAQNYAGIIRQGLELNNRCFHLVIVVLAMLSYSEYCIIATFWGRALASPTGMTSLHPCMCRFACLLAWTDHSTVSHFQLLFCAFCVMRKFKKGLEDIISIAVNCEQSTSSMATTRTETTCGLTYSVSER